MNRKLIWIGLSIVMAVATPLIMTQNANTAIPPVSSQNLNRLSDYIVIGKVTRIQKSEVRVKFGTNHQYKVFVQVASLESPQSEVLPRPKSLKGKAIYSSNLPAPGKTIEFHYWTVGKRIDGWAGAQGQNSHLKEGMIAKFFIRKGGQGKLHLLEPNGWQPIDQEAVK
jgi:hypothetical protein